MICETSFRRKLLALILMAVGGAQAFVMVFALWGEAERYAVNKRDVLLAEAHVLAAAVSAATASHDGRGVYDRLRSAGRLPDIRFVSVDDLEGNRVAELGAAELLSSDILIDTTTALSAWDLLRARSFAVRVPVVQGSVHVGTVVLIGDTGDLKASLKSGLLVFAEVATAAFLLALLVTLRMQRILTTPLIGLARAMQTVAANHNYTLSVPNSEISELKILIDGFNGMLAGIHERDERIARSYADLELQVQERTQDLRTAKDAAEAARAFADEANAHKSNFLATMSHEIRTPMNGMLVMAELLARSPLPPSARRYADVIWRSGKSLLAIINDILDFSKIEAGKLELERAPLDVVDMVTSVLDLFSEKAHGKGLDLAAHISVDAPRTIVGDAVRLTQVLSNLVNNAVKFTERGGVRVIVEPDDASDALRFAVEDTGAGIAADKRETIFGAFSQADMSTTRKYGGTGLGLAICRRLVQGMGSEIVIVSELAKGSTFSFTLRDCGGELASWPTIGANPAVAPVVLCGLDEFTREALAYYIRGAAMPVGIAGLDDLEATLVPGQVVVANLTPESTTTLAQAQRRGARLVAVRRPGDSSEGAVATEAALSWPIARAEFELVLKCLVEGRPLSAAQTGETHEAPYLFQGLEVLVADDNEVNQEVAKAALQQLGAKVTVVSDGVQAVAACQASHFDLVFLDGSMPNLNGFDASRKIRAREAECRIERTPIVALTAHVLGTGAMEWREAGMDDIITKPFTLDQLRLCVEAMISPQVSRSTPKRAPPKPVDTHSDVIDRSTFDELARLSANGSGDFLGRIVRLYLEHAPRGVDDIEHATRDGNLEGVAKAAHALKSMSLNIGAKAVAAQAACLELDAKNSRPPDVGEIARLKQVVSATCKLIDEEARTSTNSDRSPSAQAARS